MRTLVIYGKKREVQTQKGGGKMDSMYINMFALVFLPTLGLACVVWFLFDLFSDKDGENDEEND
jgi:hypothetical protein